MSKQPNEQFIHFLSDMYSVEHQALAQLVSAPDVAGDSALGEIFRNHYVETQSSLQTYCRSARLAFKMQNASWLVNSGAGPWLHPGMYPSAIAHVFLPIFVDIHFS